MPAVPDPSVLSSFDLFVGLTPEQLSALNNQLHRKVFPSGSNLMTAEQSGEVVYFILEGTVKIYVEQADGTTIILAILGPGNTLGEMSVVDNAGRSANVVTIENSTLLWMDRAAFQQSLRTIPGIAFNLARILSGRLRLANEQIQALAALEVENRVARQLLAFAQQYGQTLPGGDILIPIRLTQSDIAGLVGASRERINQVIVAYKEWKYISVDHSQHITIHNQKALAKRCV